MRSGSSDGAPVWRSTPATGGATDRAMTAERAVTPVAAIDCGTNSLRLLLAELRPGGGLVELLRRTEIVRLGQGVESTGAFAEEALTRTFDVLDDYATVLADAGVGPDRTRMVATSAARDVS